MFTQVELVAGNEVSVYWLSRNLGQPLLKAGQIVRLVESPHYWRVNRVFTTVPCVGDLPSKHCIGTIVELN